MVWFYHYVVRLLDYVLQSCHYMMRFFHYVVRFLRYVVLPLCVVVLTLCNVVSLFRIRVYFRCQVLLPRSLSSLRTRLSSFYWGPVPTLGIQRWRKYQRERER